MSRLPNSKLRISAAVGVGNAAIVAGRGPTRGAEGIANGSLKWPLSARDGAAPNGEGGVPNHDGNVAGWGAGGGVFSGGFAGAGATGYANTEIGQVVTLAYLQAYTDLIAQLGGLPDNASAANVQQAVTMSKAGRLFANSKGTGTVVRPLDPGMMLYPTGNKDGVMWEVEDELGNKGWVSSLLFGLSR